MTADQAGLIGRPTGRPNAPYRLVCLICRLAARLFRVRVVGLENLPRDAANRPVGGWICAGLPHRTWAEPLILVATMPVRPRLMMMADTPTAVGSWWRRLLVGWVGGVVLVPRRAGAGPRGFERQSEAVRQVLGGGAVFSVFPEQGRPARPPALRRVSPALAYFAVRTGRPIVPVVFGGTDDLFLRRPIEMRVLPAVHPPSLAAPAGSREERDTADRLMEQLMAVVEPAAAQAHAAAQPPPGMKRRWHWLHAGFPRVE